MGALIPGFTVGMGLCPECILLPVTQSTETLGGAPISWGQHRALGPGIWPELFCASWTVSGCSTWANHHCLWPPQPNKKTQTVNSRE